MRRFIKKILLFTIPILILAYTIDVIISNSINKGSEHDSWNYIYSEQADCELAIFGSSRAIFHFNSKIIEDSLIIKTWNFGMNSANIDLFALRVSEYLRNCKEKPKYITLVLDYHTFNYRHNLSRHYQLFPYLLYNKQFYKYLNKFEGIEKYYYIIPLIRYIVYIDKINAINRINRTSNYNYNGFYARNLKFNIEEFNENKKNWEKNISNYKPNPEKYYLYKEIVNSCKENNIKLNIVIAPMYYEGQSIVNNYKEIINTYRQWAKEDSLAFIDFSNDSIYKINRDTAYFYNCMHLNSKGADKFSSEMYVPWIKELYGL